jgi:hypothetical protein
MEIGDLGVGIGLGRPQYADWAWLRQAVSTTRRSSAQYTPQQLAELLYGIPLELLDLFAYRTKLAQALDLIQELQQPVQLPTQWKTPREVRSFPVGSLTWLPPPATDKTFLQSTAQLFHARKMVKLQQLLTAEQDENLVQRCAIRVQSGLESFEVEGDLITMTNTSLAALQNNEAQEVKTLRMPPRSFRQVDLMRFVAGS